MEPLAVVLFIGGLLLIGTSLFDAFCTAIVLGGGGPLTSRLARGLWKSALYWHQRREQSGQDDGGHQLLAGVGPTVILVIIVTWILLLWTGFLLVFSAVPEAVVNAQTGKPANAWERIYFTGFTISTLGVGDFVPRALMGRLLTPTAALSGFLLLTLSITYLVPVISAVVEKRQLAASIGGLGQTPQEIIRGGWDGQRLDSLEQPLVSLAESIEVHTQRHLAYPVLHFFHSTEERTAIGPRLAALSEALDLMREMPPGVQPPPASVRAARSAIDGFLSTLHPGFLRTSMHREAPERPTVEALRKDGLPIGETPPASKCSAEKSRERRRLLHAFVEDGGWHWSDVLE